VTVFEDVLLVFLLTFVILATSSAWVLKQSIEDEDAGSARAWAVVFFVSSLLAALLFGLTV
jgi:cytochrome bd-type quinol oxidase subunit 2